MHHLYFILVKQYCCPPYFTYTGLIKKYWFQYKKIEVILAYLQTVHQVAVGFVSISICMVFYIVVYTQVDLVKKRLNHLGLHRRGGKVQYTAISEVQNAIEVS